MTSLADWLRACLDDDEACAAAASPGPWRPNAERDEVLAVDDITVCDGFALSGRQLRATVEHIARHDPARVLVEVAAKRRIVDDAPHATLRLLALPYTDRAGYREEWAPAAPD